MNAKNYPLIYFFQILYFLYFWERFLLDRVYQILPDFCTHPFYPLSASSIPPSYKRQITDYTHKVSFHVQYPQSNGGPIKDCISLRDLFFKSFVYNILFDLSVYHTYILKRNRKKYKSVLLFYDEKLKLKSCLSKSQKLKFRAISIKKSLCTRKLHVCC